jgi:hypothetical protein
MKNQGLLFLSLGAALALTACNASGHAAGHSFSNAGESLGQGHIVSGAKDIGSGFSNGANATGEAITTTAHNVGHTVSQ